MTDEEPTPLEELEAAVQRFVNAVHGHPRVVTGSVVVFESVRLDEDGDTRHLVDYATTAATMALGVGLLEIGRDRVLVDLRGARAGDE